MKINRSSALIVGVLFIVATVFYMIGQLIHGPITGSIDYFEKAHADQLIVISGVLFELIGVMAIPLIAIYIFPILKPFNYELSISYVVFRSLEAFLLLCVAIFTLSVIPISQEILNRGNAGVELFQPIGVSMLALRNWIFIFGVGIVFPITALMLNAILYTSQLVPRFISVWGCIAAFMLLAGTVLDMCDVFAGASASTVEAVLSLPIAVNEMVL